MAAEPYSGASSPVMATSVRRCSKCQVIKPVEGFYRNRRVVGGRHCYCIPCLNEINRASNSRRRARLRTEQPKLWWAMCVFNVRRAKARKAALPFDITPEFLASIAPDRCPILGFDLEYPVQGRIGISPASASVDRFEATLGYVPGNVFVVSHKANTMKSNASATEHAKLFAWLLNHAALAPDVRSAMLETVRLAS